VKTLSVAQMREADRRCIQGLGIPGAVLMNNAGRSVFNELIEGPVGVVCGKGNNGGDGFVVARLALVAGFDTRVVLVADPSDIKGDALTYMRAYQILGGPMQPVEAPLEVAHAVKGLSDCAVIVDGLLGTGIDGPVRDPMRSAIEAWPAVRTVAIDVPSGMNADTGQTGGCCVRADVTVTFQFAKKGFTNPDAAAYLGKLVVADIGIPPVCADDAAWARIQEKMDSER
jgi:hydroxyethylthiazole kinase-like uncharacterized protein yjeF